MLLSRSVFEFSVPAETFQSYSPRPLLRSLIGVIHACGHAASSVVGDMRANFRLIEIGNVSITIIGPCQDLRIGS